QPVQRAGRQIARREHEAQPEVIERHALSPPRLARLFDLARFPTALRADALQEPIAIGNRQFQCFAHGDCQSRAAVLVPAKLKHAFAPRMQVDAREELLRSRLRAVLARAGMKNVRSKGRSTSCVAKHSGHSISIVVSTPQSTRSNSS